MSSNFDQSLAASTAGLLALAVLLTLPIWADLGPPTVPLDSARSSIVPSEVALTTPSGAHGEAFAEPRALDPADFGTAAEQTGRARLVSGAVELLVIEDEEPRKRRRRSRAPKKARDGAVQALRHFETPTLQ